MSLGVVASGQQPGRARPRTWPRRVHRGPAAAWELRAPDLAAGFGERSATRPHGNSTGRSLGLPGRPTGDSPPTTTPPPTTWRISVSVIQEAVPAIMGSGEFALAESYVLTAGPDNNTAFELFLSRMELHRGRTADALAHAEAAVETAMRSDDDVLADHSLLNLIAVLYTTGQLEASRDVAEVLAERTASPILRSIALGVGAILAGSLDANLDETRETLVRMAAEQEQGRFRHYVGVTWLNVADIDCVRGDSAGALLASTRAIHELTATSAGIELEGARALRGWALAQMGNWNEATAEFNLAESGDFEAVRGETLSFIAEAFALFGERVAGESVLARSKDARYISSSTADHQRLTSGLFALRRGDLEIARAELNSIELDRAQGSAGFQTRVRVARARLAVVSRSENSAREVATAVHLAARQGARLYAGAARIMAASLQNADELTIAVEQAATERPASLSVVAEVLVDHLHILAASTLSAVSAEAVRLPMRWREPVAAEVEHRGSARPVSRGHGSRCHRRAT